MIRRQPTKPTEQKKVDWVNSELDREDERIYSRFAEPHATYKDDKAIYAQLFDPVRRAIKSAWRGDIEPLKKIYPELGPFLVARKKLKKNKERHIDPVRLVAGDVRRIRNLWKKNPDKRIYRAGADVEIAKARWHDKSDQYDSEVTTEAVLAKLKPSGPSKKKHK